MRNLALSIAGASIATAFLLHDGSFAAPSDSAETRAARFPPSYSAPTWSPDGSRLAFVRYPVRRSVGVLLVSDRKGRARRVFPRRGLTPIGSIPAWAPKGRAVAVAVDSRMRVVDVATGRVRVLGRGNMPHWTPDARRLVVTVGEAGGPLDVVAVTGERRRVHDRRALWPAWSPSGRQIAFGDLETNTIRVLDLRTGRTARIGRGDAPAWSPDGSRLAFYRSTADRAPGIVVHTLATGRVRTVVPFGVESSRPPAWSPDGRSVAFSRDNEVRIGRTVTRRGSLFVASVVGKTVTARRLATVGSMPTFSPDGRTIAFVGTKRGCGSLVWTVRVDGRALRTISSCR